MIRVYDQFGRKVEIGREAWRKDVLLPNLQANRDKPDALYDLIVSAVNDDFAADVLESARWLAESDPQPQRGAMVLGIVLLQLKDFAAARDVLERAIARHGDNPYLLANLARAYAADGDYGRTQALIWQALGLEPNEETSLNWMISIANARGGQEAVLAAYVRAASLPGSWRAQLWLARYALERGDLAEATLLYEEALERANPVPADLLMQLSGDLGNRGHTELLLRLTQPRFDLVGHGLTVGNNLLRAYVELGMFAEARKLLEQLYSLQRPDWREHLVNWEQKLDDAQNRYGEVTAPLEMVVMKLDQPVWARGVLDFDTVLPSKAKSSPRIHFVCGSAEAGEDVSGKVVSQPTNDLGRMARALPMFLAEELYLRTNARTAFLLPWMKQGGFVLSARPWTRTFLPPDLTPPDLIVYLHIDARVSPWLLKVSIENEQRNDAAVVFDHPFTLQTAGFGALTLLFDLIPRLTSLLALRREESNAALGTPPAELLPAYLAAIEQALAIGLAARQTEGEPFLHQERSIFDHLFDVALQGDQLLRPRMLLVNALENQTRRRADIAREYLDKLALLQQQHALPPGVGSDLVAKGVQTVVEKAATNPAVNQLEEAIRRLPVGVEFLVVVTWAFGLPIFASIMSLSAPGSSCAGVHQRGTAGHHHLRGDTARLPRLVPAHSRLDAREVWPVVLLARDGGGCGAAGVHVCVDDRRAAHRADHFQLRHPGCRGARSESGSGLEHAARVPGVRGERDIRRVVCRRLHHHVTDSAAWHVDGDQCERDRPPALSPVPGTDRHHDHRADGAALRLRVFAHAPAVATDGGACARGLDRPGACALGDLARVDLARDATLFALPPAVPGRAPSRATKLATSSQPLWPMMKCVRPGNSLYSVTAVEWRYARTLAFTMRGGIR